MNKSMWTLAIILSAIFGAKADNSSYWMERANKFYEQSAYDSATAYYTKVVESGVTNSAVFFNLGNSYFRQNKLGLALMYFEKARALTPNDPDILANIRFANLTIEDKVPEPERGFVETILWRLHSLFSLNAQLWILLVLISLLAVFFSWGLFAPRNLRLWIVYLSTLLLMVIAALGMSAGYKIYQSESTSYAIVLERAVDAKNQPNGSTVLFTAHEGTKFRIRQKLEGWYLVSLPNGVSGWVEESAVGRI